MIKVTLTKLVTEYHADCDYDSLKFYDGPSASSTLLATFCSVLPPAAGRTVTSTGSSMFVVFESDAYVNEGEFEFSWEKVMQADGQYDRRICLTRVGVKGRNGDKGLCLMIDSSLAYWPRPPS